MIKLLCHAVHGNSLVVTQEALTITPQTFERSTIKQQRSNVTRTAVTLTTSQIANSTKINVVKTSTLVTQKAPITTETSWPSPTKQQQPTATQRTVTMTTTQLADTSKLTGLTTDAILAQFATVSTIMPSSTQIIPTGKSCSLSILQLF